MQQLREIPCTPQFRLNGEIQRTVKQYWGNVPGAMAQAPSVADRLLEGGSTDLEGGQITGGCICRCL
ncbi:hypothetical protein [Nostoc sp. MS1]|uniref:hypothetical protein n=1 Tax=Nostoc sp. MS1 TaxID=2764711 RepID=UPI001CC3977C|nr:hypothetical protein [Nostoc sp. MS1]